MQREEIANYNRWINSDAHVYVGLFMESQKSVQELHREAADSVGIESSLETMKLTQVLKLVPLKKLNFNWKVVRFSFWILYYILETRDSTGGHSFLLSNGKSYSLFSSKK